MLELADIDIERGAAQMPPLERIDERALVDDLAARDVDEDAALFHQRKALLVEEARCLRGPLAAHDDEIALRQDAVEFRGAPQFTEARRQLLTGRRSGAASADYPHPERGAEPADIEPDPSGADDAGCLAFDQERAVGAVVESAA